MQQRKNLADHIRRELADEILAGSLPSGSQIDEQMLAQRFGVSRTPAREALLQLSITGLVTLIPRQGAVVSSLSLREYVGLSEVLVSLETLATRLAARRLRVDEAEELRAAHAECVFAAESGDVAAYREANTRFHTSLYDACRNDYLSHQLRTLRARMRGITDLRFERPSRVRASLAEHTLILEAVIAGDENAAAMAMTAHISAGGNNFADMIAAMPAEESLMFGSTP